MAIGDKAAAAGLSVFPATQDVRLGYQNSNQRGDDIADLTTATNTALAGKAALSHTHTIGQITTLDGSQNYGTALQTQMNADFAFRDANIAAVSAALGAKANGYGDLNSTRFAEGPTGNAYSRTVAGGGFFQVWMDNGLQFGRNVSARKYKEEITEHVIDPSDVLALTPVSYHRIGSEDGSREFGLIADDTADTLPEICTYFSGEIDGIRYDLLAVAELAVLKEHNARIAELEADNAVLTSKYDALEARLAALEGNN